MGRDTILLDRREIKRKRKREREREKERERENLYIQGTLAEGNIHKY